MTAELRHFVVRVLERSDREEVPLSEELDSLAAYVAIENIRFGGRAELVIEAGGDAQAALVPSFLLQPLVENTLRHGLLPEKGGQVSVHARVRSGEVHIRVNDDGGANHHEVPAREGLELSNTRALLAQMYGDEFSFDIAPHENGFPSRRCFRTASRRPRAMLRRTSFESSTSASAGGRPTADGRG